MFGDFMLEEDFFEEYNLYQKYRIDVDLDEDSFERLTPINMLCQDCKSEQTFVWRNNNYAAVRPNEHIECVNYECAACGYVYAFLIFVGKDKNQGYAMKVGQYPKIDISIDENIESSLGQFAPLFNNGLICEKQGFGIASYAYYRRIVELIIDDLLTQLSDLMDDDQKEKYAEILEKVKTETQTSKKIEYAKEMLPPSLRVEGVNPLGTLYGILSEGIHTKSDNDCVEIATEIRLTITFLIEQITVNKAKKNQYASALKALRKNAQK